MVVHESVVYTWAPGADECEFVEHVCWLCLHVLVHSADEYTLFRFFGNKYLENTKRGRHFCCL
jgi:hypothetical protein